MMRLSPHLVLGAALTLAASPALAQAPAAQGGTIPQAAQGLWANGQCTDPGALLFLTGRYWALLPQQGPQELWRVARTGEGGGFTLAVADDADQTRLIMRAQGAQLETRTPGPKQPDDVIPGDAPATQWVRCPAISGGLAALHGEGLSFLGALDGFEAACAGDAAACMTAIFAWADVTRDGVLSPAELARLVRGATHMAMLATGAELDQLATALGAGALGGIVAAQLFIQSYDYDGSGSLSQAEMLQDRAPMPGIAGPAAPPATAVAGPPLGGAALAGQLGALRTLLDQLGPMMGLPQR